MKIKHLLIFLVVSLFLISCEHDENVGYKFTGLDLNPVNTSSGMPEACNDSVPAAVFGIRLYLFPQVVYDAGGNFDPYESSSSNVNPISKITITSDAPFNSEPPGTPLNNYFVHFPGNYMHTQPIEVGGTIDPTARYHEDYADLPYPEYTEILLRKTISIPSFNKFYIQLDFKFGGAFIDSTRTIYLY